MAERNEKWFLLKIRAYFSWFYCCYYVKWESDFVINGTWYVICILYDVLALYSTFIFTTAEWGKQKYQFSNLWSSTYRNIRKRTKKHFNFVCGVCYPHESYTFWYFVVALLYFAAMAFLISCTTCKQIKYNSK